MPTRVVLLVAALLLAPAAHAAPPTLKEATALLVAKEYARAAAAYEAIVRSEPGNGAALSGLGQARHFQKDYPGAIAAYEQALALGFRQPGLVFNLACAYALNHDADHAFAQLERAAAAGNMPLGAYQTDPDLASLRSDARFARLLAAAQKVAAPCEAEPATRQLDFWLGDWEVFSQQGARVGHSRIEKILGGCVVLESWSGGMGHAGKSFNDYDAVGKQWQQTWVDDSGTLLVLRGEWRDGALRYRGETHLFSGATLPKRLTFTPLPDGRVRQLGETSADGGKRFTTEYDFVYVRAR